MVVPAGLSRAILRGRNDQVLGVFYVLRQCLRSAALALWVTIMQDYQKVICTMYCTSAIICIVFRLTINENNILKKERNGLQKWGNKYKSRGVL